MWRQHVVIVKQHWKLRRSPKKTYCPLYGCTNFDAILLLLKLWTGSHFRPALWLNLYKQIYGNQFPPSARRLGHLNNCLWQMCTPKVLIPDITAFHKIHMKFPGLLFHLFSVCNILPTLTNLTGLNLNPANSHSNRNPVLKIRSNPLGAKQ